MTYNDCLKHIWKGSKSMVDYCNHQSDHICPPITIAPRHPTNATLPGHRTFLVQLNDRIGFSCKSFR